MTDGRGERAQQLADDLTARNVSAVALGWVDNAGITRVKTVPTARLPYAATMGIGMSPVFDVFVVDDSITTSEYIGGPVGDLRLVPDLSQLRVLEGQPGWAWAPVDRLRQDGSPWDACSRTFARRLASRAAERGVTFQMAFELEWFVGRTLPDGTLEPACGGPAYGMTRVIELSSYSRALIDALVAQGVPVVQFHPEYAAGQLELSVAPADPVSAADLMVLVRQTIRAVSLAYGLQVSFAPVVVPGSVGNGAHLHLSPWAAGSNLLAGGRGTRGLTAPGEALLAGLVSRLPALCALLAPSVSSYLRLVPQAWAAPFQCWGVENREAALRFVPGNVGTEARSANAELKCVDGSANPYLVVGAVIAAALAGLDEPSGTLPSEVTVDPASLPESEQPARLPQSVAEALAALEADPALTTALGEPLLQAFLAVHRAEAALFADATPDEIVAATRWKY
ncbi:type I glutamate--ammonia ligase [Tenggerimyces flavus]|uniref:Glutamine synthetase family protein n=1 Tax=Tenggerimyces flavus TaxID=1708749 RepID=A0ABV7YLQ1_9ACTN|nr:glutamine synthetase family protein [Tenggerimyces flavus]MBM7787548.1 glutamine synthetase [Tenggerimyces flavus]